MKLKKLLASILCVAMVLSTMSFTAFAAGDTDEANAVASIGDQYYSTVALAMADAQENDTIVIHKEINALTAPTVAPLTFKAATDGIKIIGRAYLPNTDIAGVVTYDGFDFTDNTDWTVLPGEGVEKLNDLELVYKNCKFGKKGIGIWWNKDKPDWNLKKITLDNCTAADAKEVFSLQYVDEIVIKNCDFSNSTQRLINVSAASGDVTVDKCNFGAGAIMLSQNVGDEERDLTVTNSTFAGEKAIIIHENLTNNSTTLENITVTNNTIAKETEVVSFWDNTVKAIDYLENTNVTFNENKTSEDTVIREISNGFEVVNGVIIPAACQCITVAFENATDADGKEIAGLYNIVLNAADGADIYEFVSAELTFANTSKTVAIEDMNYEILGISGTTNAEKSIEKADTYALRLVDGAKRMTGSKLVIGQVKFYGQGDINFTVSEGKVVTTEYGTNLGRYYTLDANDTTDDTLKVDAITNNKVEEVTRTVVVKVAYNHALDGAYWKDAAGNAANQITVTLKDGFGNVYDAKDLTDGVATINNVKLGRLTVTLEAPGFRKYVYNTTLEAGADANDALVLNFWNNVKRNEELNGVVVEPLAEIETGKGCMAHNFVVGDIVMDYTVDEYDLAAVTSYYGMYELTDANKYIKYDLNRDGNIDIIDVHYVLHTLNN